VRVQLSVYMTAMGGFVAGLGDLTFDMAGYILALSSAMATAAYVVIVGKLGEELQLDCVHAAPVQQLLVPALLLPPGGGQRRDGRAAPRHAPL